MERSRHNRRLTEESRTNSQRTEDDDLGVGLVYGTNRQLTFEGVREWTKAWPGHPTVRCSFVGAYRNARSLTPTSRQALRQLTTDSPTSMDGGRPTDSGWPFCHREAAKPMLDQPSAGGDALRVTDDLAIGSFFRGRPTDAD
jgi:hypothetical protein